MLQGRAQPAWAPANTTTLRQCAVQAGDRVTILGESRNHRCPVGAAPNVAMRCAEGFVS